ncbi:unnamed protein product [Phytomonas sp. EM1]|nr:unnamed protein product [Phytomonas sp. EM1]|eukprot:CCW62097.1 unnamed protein product [Phytomonas sp. isolate EM1]
MTSDSEGYQGIGLNRYTLTKQIVVLTVLLVYFKIRLLFSMPGIDYSKWDHIEVSTSSSLSDDGGSHGPEEAHHGDFQRDVCVESESGESYAGSGRDRRPRVVKLSGPSRVMIGPGGMQLSAGAEGYPSATASPFRNELSTCAKQLEGEGDDAKRLGSSNRNVELALHPANAPISCEVEKGKESGGDDDEHEEILYRNLILNGGREGNSHLWAQTSDTFTVSFIVPMDMRGRDVRSVRIYNEEVSEEGKVSKQNGLPTAPTAKHSRIRILFASAYPLREAFPSIADPQASSSDYLMELCKTFRYGVKTDEDLLEGCWELITLHRRALRLLVVHLFKEPIGMGITLWWDRCFVSDVASVVDTRALESRRDLPYSTAASSARKNEKGESFQEAWRKAHEMFHCKMKLLGKGESV